MTERAASLPMYDFPECVAATDEWWAGLARHFAAAGVADPPSRLTRPSEGADFWLRPDMLFSQTCGYPLITALAGRVTLLATPCNDSPGCEGPDYSSLIVVREDAGWIDFRDLRGAVCAVNAAESWSGHHALRLVIAREGGGEGAFCTALRSGSHAASIAAVAEGHADFAAIDCVTHAMLARHRPGSVAGTRVLCRSPAMPGLPLIAGQAASARDVKAMREGLAAAREALGLVGLQVLPPAEYGRLSTSLEMVERAGVPPLL